jgi:hypothetical protein
MTMARLVRRVPALRPLNHRPFLPLPNTLKEKKETSVEAISVMFYEFETRYLGERKGTVSQYLECL